MTAIDKIKLAKQASSVLAQSNSNLKNSALLAIARFLTENAVLTTQSGDTGEMTAKSHG